MKLSRILKLRFCRKSKRTKGLPPYCRFAAVRVGAAMLANSMSHQEAKEFCRLLRESGEDAEVFLFRLSLPTVAELAAQQGTGVEHCELTDSETEEMLSRLRKEADTLRNFSSQFGFQDGRKYALEKATLSQLRRATAVVSGRWGDVREMTTARLVSRVFGFDSEITVRKLLAEHNMKGYDRDDIADWVIAFVDGMADSFEQVKGKI